MHGWEPYCCFDSFPVGWGRVSDMWCADGSKLVAASAAAETVAVWVVDLERVNLDRTQAKAVSTHVPASASNVPSDDPGPQRPAAPSRLPPGAAAIAARTQTRSAASREDLPDISRLSVAGNAEPSPPEAAPFVRQPRLAASPEPVRPEPTAAAAEARRAPAAAAGRIPEVDALGHTHHARWNRSAEKPMIPSTRERPLDLDVAAFLPVRLCRTR